MNFDSTPQEAHKFVYNAIIKSLKVLDNLKCKGSGDSGGIAGKDWYRRFMNRHKTLSVRMPEGTSL
jgi:hypothetical protein